MPLRFVCLILLVLPALVKGQGANPFMEDVNGKPFYMHADYRLEGTPYLSDNYQMADVTDTAGKIYRNIMVKIDLAENRVLYKVEAEKEMIAALPLSRIVFNNYINENGVSGSNTFIGFPKAINEPGATVYQVLDSGTVSLLKNIKITYRDDKKYGDAGYTRTFTQTETLLALLPGNKLVKIEKNAAAVASLFPDKKNEIITFIDSSHLKCKTEKELSQVFRYYNSLK